MKLRTSDEPVSSIPVYAADILLLASVQRKDENRVDAHRRIFLERFGDVKVQEAIEEIRKKSARQIMLQSNVGEQLELMNEKRKEEFKDIPYTVFEIRDILFAKMPKTNDQKDLVERNRYTDKRLRIGVGQGQVKQIASKSYTILDYKWVEENRVQ